MSKIEEWRTIPSHPFYAASSEGRIMRLISNTSTAAGRILNPSDRGNGYLCVSMRINGKWRAVSVHRLVAETYLGKCEGLTEVNHKNGKRQDNRIANLEYASRSENAKHAYKIGLQDRKQNRGQNNGQSKLTESQVKEILSSVDRSNGYCVRLAEKYGVKPNHISRIVNGDRWKHLKKP